MGNPFQKRIEIRPSEKKQNREVDPEANPVLPCKICGHEIQRKEYGDHDWEHTLDEWIMEGGKLTSEGKYDHQATPHFIDVTFKEV